MTKWLLLTLAALLLAGVASAQEKLTLTTPVTQASITDYQVDYIGISRASWSIVVQLHPSNTSLPNVTCTWADKGLICSTGYTKPTAPTGQTLIIALNTANLSTAGNSLEARIYKQLVTDGAFAGSVTGSPQ